MPTLLLMMHTTGRKTTKLVQDTVQHAYPRKPLVLGKISAPITGVQSLPLITIVKAQHDTSSCCFPRLMRALSHV